MIRLLVFFGEGISAMLAITAAATELSPAQTGYWDGRQAFNQTFNSVSTTPSLLPSPQVIFDANDKLIVAAHRLTILPPYKDILQWDGIQWSVVATNIAEVQTLIRHDQDILVAGSFTNVDGVAAANIARWTGTRWAPMGAGLNGRVFALASEGTNVLAGGEFTGSGDTPLSRVARWNGLNWEPVGESLPGAVTALLTTNGVIYASWRTEPSRAVVGILRDGKWQTLGDSSVIRSMVFFEDSLFVGGSVGQGEMQIRSVAQLKDGVWQQPGQPLVSGFVNFTVIAGKLHLSGSLIFESNVAASLARLEGNRWVPIATPHMLDVSSVAARGSNIIVASRMLNRELQPGYAQTRLGFWQFDGTRWFLLNNGVQNWPSFYRAANAPDGVVLSLYTYAVGPVRSPVIWDGGGFVPTNVEHPQNGTLAINRDIAGIDGKVYAHASLYSADNSKTNLLAVLTPERTWVAATSPIPLASPVMAGDSRNIWVAGALEGLAPNESAVYQWNGAAWTRLGGAFTGPTPVVDRAGGSISSLTLLHDQLFVGGTFTNIAGQQISYLARWNGGSWESAGLLDGPVTSMAAADRLYVVGSFRNAADQQVNGAAVWDGRQWSSLGTGLTNAFPNYVTVSPTGLVTVLARFSDNQPPWLPFSALVWRSNRWEPLGSFDGTRAKAGVWRGKDLYVMGDFNQVNDLESARLAIWHEAGAALGEPDVSASGVEFEVSGAVPAQTTLERSDDLETWTSIRTNTFGIPGQTLHDNRDRPSQFYRLRLLD